MRARHSARYRSRQATHPDRVSLAHRALDLATVPEQLPVALQIPQLRRIMEPLYIAGIAMTVFGRHTARTLDDLAHDALDGALKDAGCSRADIGAAYYA